MPVMSTGLGQVLQAMMESEEVVLRLQRKIGSEAAVLITMGSAFHGFGAKREKSLGRVECYCPGLFSEGTLLPCVG